MKHEYLDVVDENGNIIGRDTRENLHRSPDKLHMTVNILILDSKNQVLVQQRSKKKEFGPGIWEISAGGHVSSGETPDETAKKELFEELGIDVNLKFIAKRIYKFPKEIELAHLYVGYSDGPFKLDASEIEQVKFVDFDKLSEFLKRRNKTKSMLEYWLEEIIKNKELILRK